MSFYGTLEKDNSIKIHINDRPYKIHDKGEGECEIIIVDQLHPYIQDIKSQTRPNRIIIVDITPAWEKTINDMSLDCLFELAKDIHLLADIYWIDKLQIKDLSNNLQLGEILKSIFRNRIKDELALDYY
ncbi:hypothetical protein C9J03_14740 [Photobacterium gaetbulicola]|uniref:Uncharacterized protein n=2 Tax=Photobacterium gaetbulicola TaxID=1295392 RepID=A0A0C5W1F9_9GAMM|nr:hypothetical protein [Photobacterium gaetbulicola]AJR05166.1 hypothetical protein H744_1c0137 [Photobacterium gaetbulicola Gung47]KHT64224.1 hypothetical protein RJ45_07540 [Photobacterium gaetbulicola]PSU06812.1 hypothetical protein C9J03_14740 [Photobacterium gaetbulicola]